MLYLLIYSKLDTHARQKSWWREFISTGTVVVKGRAWWPRYPRRSRQNRTTSNRFWRCTQTALHVSPASLPMCQTSQSARTKLRLDSARGLVHRVGDLVFGHFHRVGTSVVFSDSYLRVGQGHPSFPPCPFTSSSFPLSSVCCVCVICIP